MAEQLLRGHYQIIRTLSSGGFGQTYLAHDTDIPGNPICVVKQLKPLTQTPTHLEVARQLFEREAQKLTILGKHDQIPRLLAYFKENDEFYLVQEYIEGHTLDAELHPGQRWAEAQVIDLLQQMLSVLVYVHDEGVIHRDIKPTNIIRRQQDNKLVLIDFGAVKEVAQPGNVPGAPVTIATGTQIGTIGYMPTEQGRGKPKPSSDLYALGMIGIQALTGRYPHQLEEDPNTGETIWQSLTLVSPGLATVLTQMTRYHFKDRYQSAVEALQAVRQLVPSGSTAQPGVAPTVAATQMAMEAVQELTLSWTEAGQVRSQVIRPQQATKFPGRVRVGRDPAQCDIVLSHPTVSALHIEILFQPQQQYFLMRNLREKNPPYVNGQLLTQGEVALHQGSVVRLGEAELQVVSVALKQYPVGSVPSASFSTPQPSSFQPVAPTVQAGQSSSSYSMNAEQYAANVSSTAHSPVYNSTSIPSSVNEHTSKETGVFWRWFLATLAGYILGFIALFITALVIAVAISGTTDANVMEKVFRARWSSSLAWCVFGLTLGALQWTALRKKTPKATDWISATAIGYTLYGSLLAASDSMSFSGASGVSFRDIGIAICGGLIIGLAQWFHYLRKYIANSAWWVLLAIITSLLGSLASVSGITLVLMVITTPMLEAWAINRLLKQQKN